MRLFKSVIIASLLILISSNSEAQVGSADGGGTVIIPSVKFLSSPTILTPTITGPATFNGAEWSQIVVRDNVSVGNSLNVYMGTKSAVGTNAFNFGLNRSLITGNFDNTGMAHSAIQLNVASGDSNIQFQTSPTNNVAATTWLQLEKNGVLTINGTSNSSSIQHDAAVVGGLKFQSAGGIYFFPSGTTNTMNINRSANNALAVLSSATAQATAEFGFNHGLANGAKTYTSGSGGLITDVASYTPASGSGSFASYQINPTINGTSSGIAYGLAVASKTNTLTGGTIRLASFGTTTTDVFTGYTEITAVKTTGLISQSIETAGTGMAVANVGANSCGTSAATIAGNNNAGAVTVGATSGTQCRIAFTVAAPNRRHCTASNETTGNLARGVYVDTTHSDLIGTFVAGDVVTYICFAR